MDWLWGGLLGWGLSLASAALVLLVRNRQDTKRIDQILALLKAEYDGEDGRPKWASTKMISSRCRLAEEKVRALCINEKRIRMSVGEKEDLWGLVEVVGEARFERK